MKAFREMRGDIRWERELALGLSLRKVCTDILMPGNKRARGYSRESCFPMTRLLHQLCDEPSVRLIA